MDNSDDVPRAIAALIDGNRRLRAEADVMRAEAERLGSIAAGYVTQLNELTTERHKARLKAKALNVEIARLRNELRKAEARCRELNRARRGLVKYLTDVRAELSEARHMAQEYRDMYALAARESAQYMRMPWEERDEDSQ